MSRKSSLLVRSALAGMALAALCVGLGAGMLAGTLTNLPSLDELETIRPSTATQIFAADGNLIAEFYEQRRLLLEPSQVPPLVSKTFEAVEDRRFREHWGIDFTGIFRAMAKNVLAGRIVEGASTITQQLARNLFLTQEQTVPRKLKEQYLAYLVERTYTKDEILTLYLNQVYFGSGVYGVAAAAQTYFRKDAKDLAPPEVALLAGLVKNPAGYSPFKHPERAKKRRSVVLGVMEELQVITPEEAAAAREAPLGVVKKRSGQNLAPFFVEEVRRWAINRYGSEKLYREGLKIYTTLDVEAQKAAEKAVKEGLEALKERWKGRKDYPAHPEGALLAMDPQTGAIRALVGGYDYEESEFDRAVQAQRQAGSVFKPFIYMASLLQGDTPATLVTDAPTTFITEAKKKYTPKNYKGEYLGEVTLQMALAKSLNSVSVQLLDRVGIDTVISLARSMGVSSPLSPYLSLALGAFEVNLQEMVAAFAVFDSGGEYRKPFFIERVEDGRGITIYTAAPSIRRILSPQAAFLMTYMLQGVVKEGTGRAASRLPFPVAGKTGTTNDCTDAWFLGFSPVLVTGVWVGNDTKKTLGRIETGGRAALPIWKAFMEAYHNRRETPKDFPEPDGIEWVRICPESGLRSTVACPNPKGMPFLPGTAPARKCGIHYWEEN